MSKTPVHDIVIQTPNRRDQDLFNLIDNSFVLNPRLKLRCPGCRRTTKEEILIILKPEGNEWPNETPDWVDTEVQE